MLQKRFLNLFALKTEMPYQELKLCFPYVEYVLSGWDVGNFSIRPWLLKIKIRISELVAAAAAAKSLQLCPILCNPIDCLLPGFSVPGILQTRTLEWVAISFSNAWKWKVKVKSLSHVWLLATSWTAVYQAPPSMGLSRQEYWSGMQLPFPFLSYYILNSQRNCKV